MMRRHPPVTRANIRIPLTHPRHIDLIILILHLTLDRSPPHRRSQIPGRKTTIRPRRARNPRLERHMLHGSPSRITRRARRNEPRDLMGQALHRRIKNPIIFSQTLPGRTVKHLLTHPFALGRGQTRHIPDRRPVQTRRLQITIHDRAKPVAVPIPSRPLLTRMPRLVIHAHDTSQPVEQHPLCAPTRRDAYGITVNKTNTQYHPLSTADQQKWDRLIKWASNPRNPSSLAGKINRYVHNPQRAEEIALDLIDKAVRDATRLAKKKNIIPAMAWYAATIRRIHLERWMQSHGFPATYIRAGKIYEPALAKYRAAVNGSPTPAERDRIWDKAISEWADTHPNAGRYPRLADGGTSNPHADIRPIAKGPWANGRAWYEHCVNEFFASLRAEEGLGSQDATERRDLAADAEAHIETQEGDLARLINSTPGDRRAALDRLRALKPTDLLDMGLDPRTVEQAARILADQREATTNPVS